MSPTRVICRTSSREASLGPHGTSAAATGIVASTRSIERAAAAARASAAGAAA
jgi:hypothetical protein